MVSWKWLFHLALLHSIISSYGDQKLRGWKYSVGIYQEAEGSIAETLLVYPSVLQFLGLAFQDQAWCSASALVKKDLLLPALIHAEPREMCRAAPPGGASGDQRGAAGPLPAPCPQQALVLGMPPPLHSFFPLPEPKNAVKLSVTGTSYQTWFTECSGFSVFALAF